MLHKLCLLYANYLLKSLKSTYYYILMFLKEIIDEKNANFSNRLNIKPSSFC